MPFPLAHPAAVLPFRRYAPTLFSFRALVLGSLVPDLGYCFSRWKLGSFSHQFTGSFVFCLPVGLAAVFALQAFARTLMRKLPQRYQPFWLPLCAERRSGVAALVISVLVGAWTHQLLDTFTHKNGWGVNHFELLQVPLFWMAGHQVRLFHALWYACSFGGVAILCLAYENWRRAVVPQHAPTARGLKVLRALLYGALALLLGAVHHLTHADWGLWATGVLSLLLVLAISGSFRLEKTESSSD